MKSLPHSKYRDYNGWDTQKEYKFSGCQKKFWTANWRNKLKNQGTRSYNISKNLVENAKFRFNVLWMAILSNGLTHPSLTPTQAMMHGLLVDGAGFRFLISSLQVLKYSLCGFAWISIKHTTVRSDMFKIWKVTDVILLVTSLSDF